MKKTAPHASIVTPVYNGEKYLAECIESVLAQNYKSWDYTIVNNCSKDNSLKIAQSYANKYKTIKIINNKEFVGVIENHNIAFQHISPASKYSKILSADDSLNPYFLSKTVDLAEANPSVGIIGSYQKSGDKIKLTGLPPEKNVFSGSEVCRSTLLGKISVFGNPTTTLYRSDLIRNNVPFFPHLRTYADISSYYKYLMHCDYGFVHDVLSYERIHQGQVSEKAVRDLGMGSIAILDNVLQYGPLYFDKQEFEKLKKDSLENYWNWLGACILQLKGKEFWRLHSSILNEFGYSLPWGKILRGAIIECYEELQQPQLAFQKIFTVLKNKFN